MDIPVQWLPLLCLAGVFAGFVNVIAGGGSFFSFPMLILLGFPPQLATGTLRVTIVMQNLVAVPTYAHSGYFFPRQTLLCSLVTIPAALAGSFTAVRLDPAPFRHVSAILVLAVLCTLFIQPGNWTRTERLPRIRWGRMLTALAAVGFYGGFFQLGAGMPFLAAAVLAGGWDLVSANSLKVSVILLFTIIALVVFAMHGDVDWGAGVALGAGNMVGAWLGARSAVKRGPGWIRWVLVVMAVLAAARLLFPGDAAAA
ncbi:sulfite exporter TauE/SafE family protein [bacterium]|nr:sulfite exporter TauE/SafE family protein [bacterium]